MTAHLFGPREAIEAVRRARRHDPRALAVLARLGRAARQGVPRAVAAARHVERFLNRNPVARRAICRPRTVRAPRRTRRVARPIARSADPPAPPDLSVRAR